MTLTRVPARSRFESIGIGHTYTIDRALADRNLLGAALGSTATWRTWLVVLRAAFGLPLDKRQRQVFSVVAGGRDPPCRRCAELWCIAGRRSGKSRVAAAISVYIACFVTHELAPGEKGLCLVLAASVEQAKVVFGYALAFLRESPVLRREIIDVTATEIRLRNNITIAVHASSFRTTRGRTLLCAIFDEVSFWRDDTSATPDAEVYTAIGPSLMRPGGAGMLIGISSPYRKVGLLHAKHKQHFGQDGDDVLVVQAPTVVLNPSLTEEMISAQRATDPTGARSEWDAEFRADISGFLDDATIDGSVDHDRPLELPPRPGVRYAMHADPSGLAANGDAYAVCVSHREGERLVVDGVWSRRGPADPGNVTREFAAIAKCYHIAAVGADRYAAEWPVSMWREFGITLTTSELSASELYLEALPLFMRGLVRLPNHPALLRELRLLERIPSRSGRDQVTHPRNCHDDLANATCACLVALVRGPGAVVIPQELLGRIMAMPKRREHGSGRSPVTTFAFGNSPPADRQGYPASFLRHLKV